MSHRRTVSRWPRRTHRPANSSVGGARVSSGWPWGCLTGSSKSSGAMSSRVRSATTTSSKSRAGISLVADQVDSKGALDLASRVLRQAGAPAVKLYAPRFHPGVSLLPKSPGLEPLPSSLGMSLGPPWSRGASGLRPVPKRAKGHWVKRAGGPPGGVLSHTPLE